MFVKSLSRLAILHQLWTITWRNCFPQGLNRPQCIATTKASCVSTCMKGVFTPILQWLKSMMGNLERVVIWLYLIKKGWEGGFSLITCWFLPPLKHIQLLLNLTKSVPTCFFSTTVDYRWHINIYQFVWVDTFIIFLLVLYITLHNHSLNDYSGK